MIEPPRIEALAAQRMALIHLDVARRDIRTVMGPALAEVRAVLAAQGVAASGPWFTHHLRIDPTLFDVEVCVPIDTAIAPSGRVRDGLLPAATVARTLYHGPYEGLPEAWSAFGAWIAASGHRSAPDLWERYIVAPDASDNPSDWRTELNRPLTPPS